MPTYKLYYGNAKGYGELSRYLFAIGKQEFEDVRLGGELKFEDVKSTAPFGRIPFLEIDGQRFGQNASIARYLANKFNLAGNNDLEKLKADGIVDFIQKDICFKILSQYYEKNEERKAALKKEIHTDTSAFYKKLEEQVEGDKTFLKSGLSWADVVIYNFHVDFYADRYEAIDLSPTPKLKSIIDNVAANEHVKQWVAKRPVTEY